MNGEGVTERNRRIAIAVNEMTGMSDDASFVAYFTEDAVWHLNRRSIHGHDGLVQISQRAREAFPAGIERQIRSVVAEGDRVVIQHTNEATTKDGVPVKALHGSPTCLRISNGWGISRRA